MTRSALIDEKMKELVRISGNRQTHHPTKDTNPDPIKYVDPDSVKNSS